MPLNLDGYDPSVVRDATAISDDIMDAMVWSGLFRSFVDEDGERRIVSVDDGTLSTEVVVDAVRRYHQHYGWPHLENFGSKDR